MSISANGVGAPAGPECVVVMPAWNEEACIADVVTQWHGAVRSTLGPDRFELLVVDDGSTDGTPAILDALAARHREIRVLHQPNGGHGAAILAGYRHAVERNPDFVFQVDSDAQFEPDDFDLFWHLRNDSPFILGQRVERHDAPHRLIVSRLLRALLLCLFRMRIPDANIPCRLISRECLAASLRDLPEGVFAPNVFLSVLAVARGCNSLNLTVHHRPRAGGASSLGWNLVGVCLRSARELVKFRRRLRRGGSRKECAGSA
ncbi:MAG: glycosyltransferase family 2 protein [Lentisphaerae bacterium]|nr:glycosyltransferase family 2 protein [Lentisphaerota bacterium]